MELFARRWNKAVCIVASLLCSLPLAGQSKLLEGGTFTMQAPAGPGWKTVPGEGKYWHTLRNQKTGEALLIISEPFGQSSDLKQLLNNRADQFRKELESGGDKVLSFTKETKEIDGAQCVSVRASLDAKLAARKKIFLRKLECVTPTKELISAQYTFSAQAENNANNGSVDQMFSSMKFKRTTR